MVTGNYVLYGDRPSSESEIVEDHVHAQTIERRPRRKATRTERTASELERTLNMAQMNNDTDSIKHEKRVKEPRLLRYVSTSDIEESCISEKFETYDHIKPNELMPRRYNFTKKPKNPADGSVNYAYSRSSSTCSSPGGNLPTISEHGEQYGTYRVRPAPILYDNLGDNYENKLDKYFTKPKELKTYVSKINYDGSHPDSLYRVSQGGSGDGGALARMLRVMRWPLALVAVCVALATFVYFLMPDTTHRFDTLNATSWEQSVVEAQTANSIDIPDTTNAPLDVAQVPVRGHAQNTSEIDFYDTENEKTIDFATLMDTVTDANIKKKLPVPPVFPSNLNPEVQYGNEKSDVDKMRISKGLKNIVAEEKSTLKPHITQKPEKPLAIYFKEGSVVTSTSSEFLSSSENIAKFNNYESKVTTGRSPIVELLSNNKEPAAIDSNINNNFSKPIVVLPPLINSQYEQSTHKNLNFTSGHSKLFGISMEHAEKMKSTTQSSAYHTRVSPTLPTWRDGDDTTTKKYPVNIDAPNCRSPRQPLCRGVLPYDLSGAAYKVDGVDISVYLPQLIYLVSTNCSERVRHFACSLLEPECSPPPYPSKKPCQNLCREIAENCEGQIPQELAEIFNCDRFPKSHCVASKAPCFEHESSCSDGTCIPKEWTCDGRADCPDGEDEASCVPCENSEFRCHTGGCILRRWVCDGYADCPGGEDEADENCDPRRLEQGEEVAGSVIAPVVRHPSRVNNDKNVENDSQELLMTSDSNNALKRNFTRRPSLSRLSPYTKPKPKVAQRLAETSTVQTPENNTDITEEIKVGDLDFLDLQKDKKEPLDKKKTEQQRTLKVKSNLTRSDKLILSKTSSISNVNEQVNATMGEAGDERNMSGGNLEVGLSEVVGDAESSTKPRPEYIPIISSHVSPCPSGELRCVDGRCITLSQLCDGNFDCSDHTDENNCFT